MHRALQKWNVRPPCSCLPKADSVVMFISQTGSLVACLLAPWCVSFSCLISNLLKVNVRCQPHEDLSVRCRRVLTQAREEPGDSSRVPCVGLAELREYLALFTVSESYVHPNQYRKHNKSYQGRPLQKEPQHYQDESSVLRVADISVRACGRQRVIMLRFVENSPR